MVTSLNQLPVLTIPTPYSFIQTTVTSEMPLSELIKIILNGPASLIVSDKFSTICESIATLVGGIGVFMVLTDNPAQDTINDLPDLIAEVERLTTQLDTFINGFNSFVAQHNFNIVIEQGNMGIDTDHTISNELAQRWAERVSIYDRLVHDRCENIQRLLDRIEDLESVIEDPNFEFKHPYLLERFLNVARWYRHYTN